MGCGLHCVIQKKTIDHRGNEEWVDLVVGALDFPSSCARRFNDETADIRTNGFPVDFKVDSKGDHNGFNMGEHSIGWFYGSDFLNMDVEIPESRYVTQSIEDHQVTIVLHLRSEDEEDSWAFEYEKIVSSLQESLLLLTGVDYAQDIRFIIGYDS